MRSARTAAVVAALIGLIACADGRPPNPSRVRVDDLSVVWITLDAAGARHLGTYGNPLPTSPGIDALAADGGTVFERAYAQSAWTLPSTASFLTGRYPARRQQPAMRVDGETLATVLRDAGFATAAFSENPYVTATYGFHHGFQTFREYFPDALLRNNGEYLVQSAQVTSAAIDWLDRTAARRQFLYLHLLTPHSPYEPPAPFDGRFDADYAGPLRADSMTLVGINDGTIVPTDRDLEHLRLRYLENIAYGDHQVARVVDALRRADRLDRTIVVVSSDHGEAFREHGVMLHTTTLFEEMIHVPLVIRMPRRYHPLPARFSGIVELREVVPTLCHALQLECRVGTTRSLLRRLRSRGPAAPWVARAWTSDHYRVELGAIVTPRRKLIMDPSTRTLRLFDLASDPAEQRDLAEAETTRARRLARRLRARADAMMPARRAHDVGEDTLRRLRALGYAE